LLNLLEFYSEIIRYRTANGQKQPAKAAKQAMQNMWPLVIAGDF